MGPLGSFCLFQMLYPFDIYDSNYYKDASPFDQSFPHVSF